MLLVESRIRSSWLLEKTRVQGSRFTVFLFLQVCTCIQGFVRAWKVSTKGFARGSCSFGLARPAPFTSILYNYSGA